MTGARVPLFPAALTYAGVQSGRPPRGGFAQWGAFAELSNHILGRGGALIPWSCIDSDLTVGATSTLRFRVLPRYAATHRMWRIALSTAGAGGRVFGKFTDPSGGFVDFSLGGTTVRQIGLLEEITSRTGIEAELVPTFYVDPASTKTARIVGISCMEIPRPELALDLNDWGVSVPTCAPGAEISEGTTGYSVGALGVAVEEARTIVQRNGLFQWAVDTASAKSTTSAGYTRVFPLGADPIVIGRQLYRGETVRTVKARARARSGVGTTGNIRFTMTSGDSVVLPVTSGMAATWLEGDIDIDCDKFSNGTTGAQRSPGDKCVIEWQRTGGANSVFIESLGLLGG